MRWMWTVLVCGVLSAPAITSAQPERQLVIRFTPTIRVQYALWIASADGTRFQTIRLTDSVGRFGIGNRPGAVQMNSGFRFPYGRREGVLPIWGHARVAAGAEPFRRVIFQNRSEGWASRLVEDSSRDNYFCLSFTDGDESLDTMTCASVFNSDKGRFATAADITGGYAEPFEMRAGTGTMRELSLTSVYPPRRDLAEEPRTCEPGSTSCYNHADVWEINAEARRVMPDIDDISRATPRADVLYEVVWEVPPDWPDDDYFLWLEANTEGDYAPSYDTRVFPTPRTPEGTWDSWAIGSGYPYRGQPSVVYRIPLRIDGFGGEWSADEPHGYSDVHGLDGAIRPIDGTIVDDPMGNPGSGADRIRAMPGRPRISVEIPPTAVCARPDPPIECTYECDGARPCPDRFICGPAHTCVGMCDLSMPPRMIPTMSVRVHEDIKQAHHWAHLSFEVPESPRDLRRFEVRFSTSPIVDELSFTRAQPARTASLESEDLVVDATGIPAGYTIETDFGGLTPQTHYYVAVRAIDVCSEEGMFAVGELETKEIHFTTVSPCFVATATYGTPMAEDVRALRRFRDRHLRSTVPGRALERLYETLGPPAAGAIRDSESLRFLSRVALSPIVRILSMAD